MLLVSRRLFYVLLMAAAVSGGCKRTEQKYDGPTVDAFTGRLTQDAKPVSFSEEDKVYLQLFFEKAGGPMRIPVQSDGTFKIGWMPIGKYSATLSRTKLVNNHRVAQPYNIPGGLNIEAGKTEYNIELGPNWKP